MNKKLCGPLSVFLAAVLMIGLFNFPAFAAGIVDSGECGGNGNNVTWTLDRDGLLTISGAGSMYDYSRKEDVPWYSYREQVQAVEIQAGVTSVGQNAFRDCAKLTNVTFPQQGLRSIQNVSFYNCSSLREITIPEGVRSIGESAFGFCGLTTFFIPSTVEDIGERIFYRCASLTEIKVNEINSLYSSENGVLFDKALVETPGDTDDTGDTGDTGEGGEGGEGGGSQTSVIKTKLICYPAAKMDVEYEVPEGIQTIGSYAFHSALNLIKVTLPEGVTVIEPYAFAYAFPFDEDKHDDIILPASLTAIGESAFYECRGLSTTDENNNIKAVGNVHFAGSRQQWNALNIGEYNNCLSNANIIFGDMKQDNIIASGECGDRGSNAVWSLNDKGEFIISGSGAMSNYRSASAMPWANYTASGSEEAQDLRAQIKTLTIKGDTVENGVVTKSGITNVGDYAFYDCENLTTVKLPASLKSVGAQAFSNCAALKSVNLSATKATSVGDYAFNGSAALESVTFPETLQTIGRRAFLRSGLKTVTIPVNVKSVGEWAFRWCEQLTLFTMAPLAATATPHKSASIGNYALANCTALERVNFTENLSALGEYALANCNMLIGTSDQSKPVGVWIPESVSNIGSCAFHACPLLSAVNVDENNLTYCSASGMLMNKDKTCIYYYPPGRIGACEIPESVTSVVAFAFDGANQLKDVYYKGTQSQWDTMIAEEWISPTYNDPLLNATITCEGVEPDESQNITSVDKSEIITSEEVRQLQIVVHCGLNTGGAQVFCAIYDKEGRFLRLDMPDAATVADEEEDDDEEPETAYGLNPGTDTTLTYTLDENTTRTGQVRLLILDGENLPCCVSAIPRLSED